MQAIFVELPPFQRHRSDYLTDDEYRELQLLLLANAEAGDLIKGTGGLRKIRFGDKRRNKGKRGGLRVIHYRWFEGAQFWMFTLYDKDEMSDLSSSERAVLARLLAIEVSRRNAI
ncbi:Toxin HigB-2 [Caballeronia cordobensis]|uniref:Toxin HigB-2 n=1 Tax=Caballeronia cordobensis TaxID=1353886 RepID=A0A158HZ42_CABCO|nr:toxin [Caballeronia cordobensis]SAL49229.1 Toxin HigB-2 [Caballeronia cordobensis]